MKQKFCLILKMPRRISRKGLIRKLDRVFSLYIRTRNAKNEIVECVTCGVKKHYFSPQIGPVHIVDSVRYLPAALQAPAYEMSIDLCGTGDLHGKNRLPH